MELGNKVGNQDSYYTVYLDGHSEKPEKCDCRIYIYENAIQLEFIKTFDDTFKTVIPLSMVDAIHIETKEQIEKRVTATRVLAFGVYAFAMKKKELTTTMFLTIDITNEQNVSSTIVFSGVPCPEAHSTITKALTEFRKSNNTKISSNSNSMINFDPYEELKKLKELLDLDIVTQEEFDKKKKQLLGL